ncbi:hypothetical protein ASG90_18260 [Nocardioides sp. Soil797]|nr:hypothetical protein ASG90_18260 [Nocardioides sp. Soil797]
MVSATNSEGTDLRPGRVNDMPSLVRSEKSQYEDLRLKASDLSSDVEKLSARIDDDQVRKARREATRLEGPAGFSEVEGSALTVTLSDSPEDLREDAEDIRRLVVHQQDIQAVVNAMWDAGAEGVMIQGQRIISTTGIKCAGNSVELQGIPYPQPYVITAVGDTAAMQERIDSDYDIGLYRSDAENPAIQIGWGMEVEHDVTVPAYDGLRGLEYAEPLT